MKYFLLLFSFLFFGNGVYAQQELKVYVFFAEECPISIYMTQPHREVAKQHQDKIQYYAVFPQQKSHLKSAILFKEEYGLDNFEIIMDRKQVVTQELSASVTPEAIVTNTEGEILYRGRISNAYSAPGKMKHGKRTNELITIIEQLQSGKTIPQPWENAVGCYITRI